MSFMLQFICIRCLHGPPLNLVWFTEGQNMEQWAPSAVFIMQSNLLVFLWSPTKWPSIKRTTRKNNTNVFTKYLFMLKKQTKKKHAHLVSNQSRGGVSYMVGVCGQNVHSSQHLPALPGVRHDASGQSLRHSATQHVRPEEHLRPGYVRQGRDVYSRREVYPCAGSFTSCVCFCLSGFRSSLACWWRPQTASSTSTMWIHRMEASASWSKNTSECVSACVSIL